MVKGVIKAPNHNKHVNVTIDDLPDEQCCKDVAVVHQIQILRPGSNKIPIVLQNLSCQTVKVKKGTKIAHVMAGNVVPPMLDPQLDENIPGQAAGRVTYSGTLQKGIVIDSKNFLKVWILMVLSCGRSSNSSQLETF